MVVRIPPPRKVMMPWPPSRSDIEAAFVDLLAGTRTRKEVADWAIQGLLDDDLVLEPGWDDAFADLAQADTLGVTQPSLPTGTELAQSVSPP